MKTNLLLFRFGTSVLTQLVLPAFVGVIFLCSASASVWLSATNFAADNLPYIHADSTELNTARAAAGPGGYYKLRAKFIVPYGPGYYQAIDSINNDGQRLTGSPGAETYNVQLYWAP